MGEEFAARTPFLYFCDFGARAGGRRHARAGARSSAASSAFADPAARAAHSRSRTPNRRSLASKLRWEERDASPHARGLARPARRAAGAAPAAPRAAASPASAARRRFERRGRPAARRVDAGRPTRGRRLHLHRPTSARRRSTASRRRRATSLYVDATAYDGGALRLARGAVCVTLQERPCLKARTARIEALAPALRALTASRSTTTTSGARTGRCRDETLRRAAGRARRATATTAHGVDALRRGRATRASWRAWRCRRCGGPRRRAPTGTLPLRLPASQRRRRCAGSSTRRTARSTRASSTRSAAASSRGIERRTASAGASASCRSHARCRRLPPPVAARRRCDGDDRCSSRRAERCYRPAALRDGGRVWGAARCSSTRCARERNWGIGDFTDLRDAASSSGAARRRHRRRQSAARAVPAQPGAREPVQPVVAALFLNVLYIDVEAIDGLRRVRRPRASWSPRAEFQARLARTARSADWSTTPASPRRSCAVLELLYRALPRQPSRRRRHAARGAPSALSRARRRGAAAPRAVRGAAGALPSRPMRGLGLAGLARGVSRSRQRRGRGASRSEHARARRVLRSTCSGRPTRQLGARRRALHGARAWASACTSTSRCRSTAAAPRPGRTRRCTRSARASARRPTSSTWRARTGACRRCGPTACAPARYAPFIATLRANMRHAGALRIDHVMGLMRLYWIPPGAARARAPTCTTRSTSCSAIVALESQRHRCLVIGEDLGTVPDEVRAGAGARGVLSYRAAVLRARRRRRLQAAGRLSARRRWSRVSTHDLPTLAGWWSGDDLRAARSSSACSPTEAQLEQQLLDRARDRVRLLLALRHAGLLPPRRSRRPAARPQLDAAHRRGACTPSSPRARALLMVVQLEDVLGVREQANLPGTIDEHPNWRRKLPLPTARRWPPTSAMRVARPHAGARCGRARTRRRPAQHAPMQARIPRATYRLQLHKGFSFDDATALVPYLARARRQPRLLLAVSCARAPAACTATTSSTTTQLNPEIGDARGLRALRRRAARHGMGQLLDMVPNHMGVMGADNAWWLDVLENGPASLLRRASSTSTGSRSTPTLAGKVLLPVLGDHYGEVLERGELRAALRGAQRQPSRVHYYEHRFPLDPRELSARARRRARRSSTRRSCAAAAGGHLLPPSAGCRAQRCERRRTRAPSARATRSCSRRSWRSSRPAQPAVARADRARGGRAATWPSARDDAARAARGAGLPPRVLARRRGRDQLPALLRHQRPRRAAHGERRRCSRRRIASCSSWRPPAQVDGLRIDHPDGLYDPARYFRRLQQGYARRAGLVLAERDADGGRRGRCTWWSRRSSPQHEDLPEDWAVHGTTGYRFANVVNGAVRRHRRGERSSTASSATSSASADDFEALARRRQARDHAQRARRAS